MKKNNNLIIFIGIVVLILYLFGQQNEMTNLQIHYYEDGVEVFPDGLFSLVTPPGEEFDQISFDVIVQNNGEVPLENVHINNAYPMIFNSALDIGIYDLDIGGVKVYTSELMDTEQFESISPVNFWVEVAGMNTFSGEMIYAEAYSGDISFEAGFTECYQETATIANDCGGLSTGNYKYNAAAWRVDYPVSNIFDGSWSTVSWSVRPPDTTDYYVNYTIPSRTGWAILRAKDKGGWPYEHNINIDSECLLGDVLALKISISDAGRLMNYTCLGSSGFKQLKTRRTNTIYEEAIWWFIESSSCPISDGSECTNCEVSLATIINYMYGGDCDLLLTVGCMNEINGNVYESWRLKQPTSIWTEAYCTDSCSAEHCFKCKDLQGSYDYCSINEYNDCKNYLMNNYPIEYAKWGGIGVGCI